MGAMVAERKLMNATYILAMGGKEKKKKKKDKV